MPNHPKKPEIKLNMELSLKEANLIKKIREVNESGEFLLVIKSGEVEKIKYSTVFYFMSGRESMDIDKLSILIKEKVPFGEVNVLTRFGKPYAISATINYDDLSSGL